MQPLFWARSSTGDWLFLLTALHSLSFTLSPPFKRAKCSPTPRQPKISKIFPESMPPDPLTSLFLDYGPHAPPPPPTKNPGYAPVLLLLWFKLSPVRVSSFKRAFIFTPPAPNNLRPIVRFYNIVEAQNTQRPFGHWREPNSRNRFWRSQRYRLQMCIFFFLIA